MNLKGKTSDLSSGVRAFRKRLTGHVYFKKQITARAGLWTHGLRSPCFPFHIHFGCNHASRTKPSPFSWLLPSLLLNNRSAVLMLLAEPFRVCNEHELHAICSWRIPGQAQDIKVEVQKQIINLQFFFSLIFFLIIRLAIAVQHRFLCSERGTKRNKEEMTSEAKNL